MGQRNRAELEQLVLRANELAVAAAASQARLEAILASIGDAVLTIDQSGAIESVNLAAERLFGSDAAQVIGTPVGQWLPGLDLSALQVDTVRLQEADARRADGRTASVELSLSVLQLPDGGLYIAVLRDITERKLAAAELERMACTDALTNLINRHHGQRQIEGLLALAKRQQRPLALAAVDLDGFKQINDSHGHAVGDVVLRHCAAMLAGAFRPTDVVARWGGEEFLIALFDSSKADTVHRLTDLLQHLREDPARDRNSGARVVATFSAGVAVYPDNGTDFEALYRSADAELYAAKAAGRARVMPDPV